MWSPYRDSLPFSFRGVGNPWHQVRPFGFSGRESWANRYARFKASTPAEVPWPIHWYGIDTFNASLSEPGMFEKEDKPHFSKFRVRPVGMGRGRCGWGRPVGVGRGRWGLEEAGGDGARPAEVGDSGGRKGRGRGRRQEAGWGAQ